MSLLTISWQQKISFASYKSSYPYTGTQFVTQAKVSCKLLKINNFEHSSDASSKGLKGQFPKIVCPCIYNLIKI